MSKTWYNQRCPKCGSEHLAVVVEMWAVFTQGGTEVYHDDCPNNDQDWDGDSMMRCLDCEHSGIAEEFTDIPPLEMP